MQTDMIPFPYRTLSYHQDRLSDLPRPLFYTIHLPLHHPESIDVRKIRETNSKVPRELRSTELTCHGTGSSHG